MKHYTELKSRIRPNTLIMGDFTTALLSLEKSARQKLTREIKELTDVMTQRGLRNINRTFHPNPKQYDFYTKLVTCLTRTINPWKKSEKTTENGKIYHATVIVFLAFYLVWDRISCFHCVFHVVCKFAGSFLFPLSMSPWRVITVACYHGQFYVDTGDQNSYNTFAPKTFLHLEMFLVHYFYFDIKISRVLAVF